MIFSSPSCNLCITKRVQMDVTTFLRYTGYLLCCFKRGNNNVQCSFNYINQSIYLSINAQHKTLKVDLISLLAKCFKGNQLFLKVYKYQKRKRFLLSISGNINLDFTYLYLWNDSSRCYYRQIVISTKVLKSHYFKLR